MFSIRLSEQRAAPVQRVSRGARLIVQALCVLAALALILAVDAVFLHRAIWRAVADREPAVVHAIKDHAGVILPR